MKTFDRHKIQEILNDIQNDNFKPRDLDSLLILIRDNISESNELIKLYDLCHFVAHKNNRDRGPLFDHISRISLFFIMANDLRQENLSTATFPAYVKNYLIIYLRIKRSQTIFFGVKRSKIQEVIKDSEIVGNQVQLYIKEPKTADAICRILGDGKIEPFMDGDEFYHLLTRSFKILDFTFNISKSQKIRDKIVLSLLMIIHETKTTIGNYEVTLTLQPGNSKGSEFLTIFFSFILFLGEDRLPPLCSSNSTRHLIPAITSNLLVKEYCSSATLEHIRQYNEEFKMENDPIPSHAILDTAEFKIDFE